MSAPPARARLTKRGLKALRHRSRNKPSEDGHDVPEVDFADEATEPDTTARNPKRPHADPLDAPPAKKRRKDVGDVRPKYVCFIGNLAYTITAEQLAAHFSEKCQETPVVRLLTKRAPADADAASKGCAFVEFASSGAHQEALKLHRSRLGGRKINGATERRLSHLVLLTSQSSRARVVMLTGGGIAQLTRRLTAGGGGKGDARRAKIAKAKARLDAQRAKQPAAPPRPNTETSEPGKQTSKNAKRQAKRTMAPERKPTVKRSKQPSKPQLSGANAVRLG